MDQNNQKYYTIGEVAKIMGQHPQSIRYYERLGILQPARVDPETGYRYYTPSQLIIFSAIRLHTQLGMPLRDFSRYYHDGVCHTGSFFREAAERLREQITELESSLDFIRSMVRVLDYTDRLTETPEGFRKEFPDKYYLVSPISPELTEYDLFFALRQLRQRAENTGLQPLLGFGRIAIYENGQPPQFYAAQQIDTAREEADIFCLPGGEYFCIHAPESTITNAPALFPDAFARGTKQMVLESPLIASVHSMTQQSVVLRCRAL